MHRITVGNWRPETAGPMQVISGPMGRERVHFEAPGATRPKEEMRGFLQWYERKPEIDLVLRAAIAHLLFVTIHPFEDGNGRIARAIADMALARSEESPQRFCSMSAQIRSERNAYYDILEETQHGDLDVTRWLRWFLEYLARAFTGAESILEAVLSKDRFWEVHAATPINERQKKLVGMLLDGFGGKLTSSK